MRPRLLMAMPVAAALAACTGLYSHPPDGGSAGGGSASAGGGTATSGGGSASSGGGTGSTGGGGSSSSGGGSAAAGGGTSSSGGGSAAAGGGTSSSGGGTASSGGGASTLLSVVAGGADSGFTFELIPVTGPPPSFEAIRGRSASDVWLAGGGGQLLHFDGGSWEVGYQDNVNSRTFKALLLTTTGVVAAGPGLIVECADGCGTAPAVWSSSPQANLQLEALCGSAAALYAVGWDSASASAGRLLRRQSDGGWALHPGLPGTYFNDCLVLPDGDVLIAAYGHPVLVRGDGGITEETVPGLDISKGPLYWQALARMGSDIIAVGFGRRVARRSPAGVWTLLAQEVQGDQYAYDAVASTRADEAQIAGYPEAPPGARAVLGPLTLTVWDDLPYFIHGLYAANDTTWFFAGESLGVNPTGVVVRATRTP